ncbi:ogr/Delta-like zinc finger family protein [Duffyella gerundensis]|uniref:ogr/Delta-like zinc finger family protein n=1 Tax=Duffyella gerundensis TaxID=1619313 RepID=UPI0016546D6D|nr:ogr/Delta-like zinc finger family protein [Duffyella gerundensis]
MMHCPYCKSPAHAKSSRYMSEQVKERYHQCTNLECSCSFKTNESITRVITAPPQPEKLVEKPPEPVRERQTLGRYGAAFRILH